MLDRAVGLVNGCLAKHGADIDPDHSLSTGASRMAKGLLYHRTSRGTLEAPRLASFPPAIFFSRESMSNPRREPVGDKRRSKILPSCAKRPVLAFAVARCRPPGSAFCGSYAWEPQSSRAAVAGGLGMACGPALAGGPGGRLQGWPPARAQPYGSGAVVRAWVGGSAT